MSLHYEAFENAFKNEGDALYQLAIEQSDPVKAAVEIYFKARGRIDEYYTDKYVFWAAKQYVWQVYVDDPDSSDADRDAYAEQLRTFI